MKICNEKASCKYIEKKVVRSASLFTFYKIEIIVIQNKHCDNMLFYKN